MTAMSDDPVRKEARIRPAGPDDLPDLLALYRHLNPDDPTPVPTQAAASWKRMLASDMVTVLVAEVDGRPVSTCMLVVVPNLTRDAAPFAMIENVVTHADHRTRGHGHAVLYAALEAAWAAGCYKVMLMTGSRRESTLRFYEQAGFDRQSKTAFHIRRSHPGVA